MSEKLQVLVSEIQRQLNILSGSSQDTHTASSCNVGALTLQAQDHSYYLQLKDLHRVLSDRDDQCRWEDILIPANCQSCVWRLLAFCNSAAPFLNPKSQQIRCGELQKLRKRHGVGDNLAEDVWQNKSLRLWATSSKSSMIIIQETFQTMGCLEQFSYEISQELGQAYPTIWMLSEPTSREYFAGHDETELLRHLSIQALRFTSRTTKASFLTDIVNRVRECATSHDWFQILKEIFQLIPRAYLIVDLNIVGSRFNQVKSWPRDFQALISQLDTNCSSRLAVMLLSSRPLLRENSNASVISVNSHSQQSQSRKRPLENYLLDSMRPLSTLTSNQSDRGPVKRKLNLAPDVEPVALDSMRSLLSPIVPDNHKPLGSCFNGRQTVEPSKHSLGNVSVTAQPNCCGDSLQHKCFLNTNPSVLPHRSDINIAVICALTLEADAVLSVFDQYWDIQAFGNLEGDKNTYSVGKISCHNVVLVHMPGMGRTPAATVAARCRASFPNIDLALVVGICGAVPFSRPSIEILLGDVIISDRIVIYDFGRQFPDTFIRKETTLDSARKPPEEIRSFLSKMKGRRSQNILHDKTVLHLHALQQKQAGYPSYPGVKEDRLFEPTYRHKHQNSSKCIQCAYLKPSTSPVCDTARTSTCDTLGCDLDKLVSRQRHSQVTNGFKWRPMIHFGAYASGDTVMKSGEHRDHIAAKEEVIAFEMEGAGVWEIFPCIIIKGVCDYADSHKNKKWQDLAAGTAAACMKAFLEAWPTRTRC
ncbi:hypothetical protein F5Y19DRAFT_217031 [Xylariaceae sp. FL1651]|nr:hypothetical protein F5Y19DRAFT_217031 [Xylariaceae sp. FL1651]